AADPTVAGPSQPAQYQSLPPCHTPCPARDSEPAGCVAAGHACMTRPRLEVAEVVHQYGDPFLARYSATLSEEQHRALRAIAVCRTAPLGAHKTQCDQCGYEDISSNSC